VPSPAEVIRDGLRLEAIAADGDAGEAAVVGEFTGGAVLADQQPVPAGPRFDQIDDEPVVRAVAFILQP